MSASLGSGQVESDPERKIIHFGSPPDETYDLPTPPEPVAVPSPTKGPTPQRAPEAPDDPNVSWWRRWFR